MAGVTTAPAKSQGGSEMLFKAISTDDTQRKQFDFYLHFLRFRRHRMRLPDHLIEGMSTTSDPDNLFFTLMATLANLVNGNIDWSIRQFMENLVESNLLSKKCQHADNDHAAVQMVFILMGWLTHLFNPSMDKSSGFFTIEKESMVVFERLSQAIEKSQEEPLSRFVNSFGSLLPRKSSGSGLLSRIHAEDSEDILKVPFLNAKHLHKIKGVKFQWTLSVGTHLEFDRRTRTLKLFCLPSILELQLQSENSHSPLSKLLSVVYDEYTTPEGFSPANLCKEVLLSYNLLFRDSPDSRKFYKKQRKIISRTTGSTVDPVLDRECGFNRPKQPLGHATSASKSYWRSTHFPILSERFVDLCQFEKEERNNTFSGILGDKSDTRERSQFVVAVLFGGVALFLALINTVLGGLQAAYSIKAYNLALRQE